MNFNKTLLAVLLTGLASVATAQANDERITKLEEQMQKANTTFTDFVATAQEAMSKIADQFSNTYTKNEVEEKLTLIKDNTTASLNTLNEHFYQKQEITDHFYNKEEIDRKINNQTSFSVDAVDTRITRLQKEITRGLAKQAALAGLFQPYNVGKINITAAVGGYKSTNALALGAGYRFNNKVAAKAALAFSDGKSSSYNISVNYEF